MSFLSGIAVYFIIWWLTLFLVLPHGVRSQAESDEQMTPGTDPGAPVNAYLGRKLLANTVLAALVFAVWFIASQYFGLTMNRLAELFRLQLNQ